ncbi:unnamed protein product [Malus baccata var. baccata]
MEGRFSRTRRPSAPPAEFFTTARSMLEQAQARNAEVLEASRAFKGHTYSNSIYYLEPWSMPGFAQREETAVASGMAMLKAKIDRGEIPGIVKGQGRIFVKKRRWEFPIPGAGELRERRPDYVPVTVEKDARSNGIPGISMKKYHVHGEMPVGEFVYFIRHQIALPMSKPLFVFFKNTEPPADALMSKVDGENRDEDGFLHMSYSGEANASGSINHEQEWMDKALPGYRRLYMQGA